jgi:hypothetical protein
LSELQEQIREIAERKRPTKPPEKTLPNDEYGKLQREGLDVEKEKSDQEDANMGRDEGAQQKAAKGRTGEDDWDGEGEIRSTFNMLRWTMAGINDNTENLSRGIGKIAKKRVLNRTLQRERRQKKNAELEGTTMKIDSMFARADENINENWNWEVFGEGEPEQNSGARKFNQNHTGRAGTGQGNLAAHTDSARSPSRICNEESAQRTKKSRNTDKISRQNKVDPPKSTLCLTNRNQWATKLPVVLNNTNCIVLTMQPKQ